MAHLVSVSAAAAEFLPVEREGAPFPFKSLHLRAWKVHIFHWARLSVTAIREGDQEMQVYLGAMYPAKDSWVPLLKGAGEMLLRPSADFLPFPFVKSNDSF